MKIKTELLVSGLFAMILLMIAGCGTSKSISAQNQCKHLVREYIADKWYYVQETNTYGETKEMVDIYRPGTERRECIGQMDKEELIEIFGKPSREDSNRWFYFYLKEDFDRFDSTRFCTYCMVIQFDDFGKIASFGFPVMG